MFKNMQRQAFGRLQSKLFPLCVVLTRPVVQQYAKTGEQKQL